MDNKSDLKVFSSNIERGQKQNSNNLYELLQLQPSKPKLVETRVTEKACDYRPLSIKYFKPRKIIKERKVKTVRNIRNDFEKDLNTYLPEELMRQENVLFKRIRKGSSKDDDTIKLAKNMLKCSQPISRSTWQILANLNPDENLHSEQYVLWNGRRLRVNGSRGGERKFICHYDLAKKKTVVKTECWSKKKCFLRNKNLLNTSLALDIKPGPLSKKKKFDVSYQKSHVGELQSVKLPQIGLEIETAIDVTIDPTISNTLQSLHEINGALTKTWAEFSVSTLCNLKNSDVMLIDNEIVTFNLNYHNNYNKLLMCSDGVVVEVTEAVDAHSLVMRETRIETVVKHLIADVITAVDISVHQDCFYTGIDEPRDTTPDEIEILSNTTLMKERIKRKYNELERLDVTVIRLSDGGNTEKGMLSCNKAFCALGCICSSLEYRYNIKSHCGRVDCMFECKCDFSRYKALSSLDGSRSLDFIPGLFNLEIKTNSKLAKEEKKFHQTVVVTEGKSILLKPQRRNLRAPKKSAEFSSGNLKDEQNERKYLSVSALRLDCVNIEPWCMVHNLYQCFCKGIFTECFQQESTNTIDGEGECRDPSDDLLVEIGSDNNKSNILKHFKSAGKKTREKYTSDNYKSKRYRSSSNRVNEESYSYRTSCARTKPYRGRKLSDKHYNETNAIIMEMEKNDVKLHSKLMSYISKDKDEGNLETPIEPSGFTLSDVITHNLNQSPSHNSSETSKHIPKEARFVSWLEAKYKHYKQLLEKNHNKRIPLEAPKAGKIALYPSEAILDRYKKRENFFVVTKHKPYRIFMAVDLNKPFFESCIAIDKVQFEDLKKYPTTVRNLLQDASDLKDNFHIMYGFSHCWELISSVTKIKVKSDAKQSDNNIDLLVMADTSKFEQKNIKKDSAVQSPQSDSTGNNSDILDVKSKWFAMTINFDFTEIQFYGRGFFVKYDSIIKAINEARVLGKTVRLVCKKLAVDNESPQFGIYAIPHPSENRVYVGPYEIDEELGIKTVNPLLNQPSEKLRGVWFATKKNDNINVINNPLEYMPPINTGVVTATENQSKKRQQYEQNEKKDTNKKQNIENNDIPKYVSKSDSNVPLDFQTILPKPVKVVKPMKISKSNGFYRVCSSGRNKQVSLLKLPMESPAALEPPATVLIASTSSLFMSETKTIPVKKDTFSLSKTLNMSTKNLLKADISKNPVAEAALQKKTVPKTLTTREKTRFCGKVVLRPKEINKILPQNDFFSHETTPQSRETARNIKEEVTTLVNKDIDNFVATSEISTAPSIADVSVVNDEDSDKESLDMKSLKDVFIECQNIKNLGWLKGKINRENKISVKFPGFKYTEFYKEDEAFLKINQVLYRKVYVPKHINIEWKVIQAGENLMYKNILKAEDFGSDFVLTRLGLRHKRDLLSLGTKETEKKGFTELRNSVSNCLNES